MVGVWAVFLCGNRIPRGARRDDEWRRWDYVLRAIRHHALFFPMAACAGLAYQSSGVFRHPGCANTGLGVRVYLGTLHLVMCRRAHLPTPVKVPALLGWAV